MNGRSSSDCASWPAVKGKHQARRESLRRENLRRENLRRENLRRENLKLVEEDN